jgi:hypothetical protein
VLDYLFGSFLRHFGSIRQVKLGYDIACQWFPLLFHRADHWPPEIALDRQLQISPAIGLFHEPAHRTANHEQFSPTFVKGVGATNFENIERLWSSHNALGNSSKTMGPGTRHAYIDDHISSWNWQKYQGHGALIVVFSSSTRHPYCSTGKRLFIKFKKAIAHRNQQVEAHRGFTMSLPVDLTTTWEALCLIWDAEPYPKNNVINPFEVTSECKFSQYPTNL